LAFACNQFRRADSEQACIGRNFRAFAFADQSMQRQSSCFCGEIPQRNVERGDSEHRDAVAAEQMQIALNPFHNAGNACGVGHIEATRLRGNHFLDGSAGGFCANIAKGVAPAGQA
jgi:hypothetical protein